MSGYSALGFAIPLGIGAPIRVRRQFVINDYFRMKREGSDMEKATLGAGCFWHVEELFRKTQGVVSTRVGYMGGAKENPTYEEVCSHTTGHAEVVEVTFDPSRISYDEILRIFWEGHDPTQLNRQGPDVGNNYRSVIFYHTPEQAEQAMVSLAREQASGRYRRPIVTEIVPAAVFWRAEEYHQQYLAKGGLSSCRL
jgi:peptide-methionine (S)-S-oxide reductase